MEDIILLNHDKRVSVADLSKMVEAINAQLLVVAGEWKCDEYRLVVGTITPPNSPFATIAPTPDAANALGYHDEDLRGRFYIKVFGDPIYDNGGTTLRGDNSVSAVLSHECCELMLDESANTWVQMPNGKLIARELCDPVQGVSYLSNRVSVSDWVLPSFFDPSGKAPYSYRNAPAKPFAVTPGGYEIIMAGGKVGYVFGESMPEWQKAAKGHNSGSGSGRRERQL